MAAEYPRREGLTCSCTTGISFCGFSPIFFTQVFSREVEPFCTEPCPRGRCPLPTLEEDLAHRRQGAATHTLACCAPFVRLLMPSDLMQAVESMHVRVAQHLAQPGHDLCL